MSQDQLTEVLLDALFADVAKGSATSGNYGHAGRPGERGGSAPGAGGPSGVPRAPVPVGTATDHGSKVLAAKLQQGKVSNLQRIGDKTSKTDIYVADLEGFGKVTIKPEAGERSSYLREVIKPGAETHREMAARIVNEALRNPVEMPAATVHDFGDLPGPDGKPIGRALVYDHIEGLTLLAAQESNLGFRGTEIIHELPDFEHMGLFDAVVGQLDRHERNIMVDEFDNLVAIDHDLTFPIRNGKIGAEPVPGKQLPSSQRYPGGVVLPATVSPEIMGRTITIDERQSRLRGGENRRLEVMNENRDKITEALRPHLPERAINAMWDRVDYMRATGEIYHLGQRVYSSTPRGPIGARKPQPPTTSPITSSLVNLRPPGAPTSMAHVRIRSAKASGKEIVYLNTAGEEIGTTRVVNGRAQSTGVGVFDVNMYVVEAGKPEVRLTPVDGDKWVEGLLETARTEYCQAILR